MCPCPLHCLPLPPTNLRDSASAYQVISAGFIQDVSTLGKLFGWSCLTHRNAYSINLGS